MNKELIKVTAEVYKENLENLTLPTSKSIGNNIGLMVDGIFGWLGVWGQTQKIKQENHIVVFKDNIKKKIEKIPKENLVEPKINIVGPTLEAAKYYFEEEYYKEMFANLICASCDSKNNKKIHPAFIETIKQLSPLEAKVLNLFQYNSTYPVAEIETINTNSLVTPWLFTLCDFKDKSNLFKQQELIDMSTSIENLVRLGIIIKNRGILELNYDYDLFKSNSLYKLVEKEMKDGSKIKIIKSRIELSNYGRNFFDICIK